MPRGFVFCERQTCAVEAFALIDLPAPVLETVSWQHIDWARTEKFRHLAFSGMTREDDDDDDDDDDHLQGQNRFQCSC